MTTKLSFAEMKAQFLAKQEAQKNNKGEGNFTNNDIYPFWTMKVGEDALVRILPDASTKNPNIFPIYIDLMEHTLAISGKDRKISCLKNYGEECPICDLSQAHYKVEGKGSPRGKYFWRSKISLLRALIQKDPLTEGESAEGTVKTLRFGWQLMQKVLSDISTELDKEPWDMEDGYDFKIKKDSQPGGENSTYALGSGFARKSSAISPKVRETIELIDLQTLLPANPGLEAVQRMLEAHISGADLDEDETPAKVEKTEKPAKVAKPAKVEEAEEEEEDDIPAFETAPVKPKKPVVQEAVEESEEEAEAEDEDDDSDDALLAQILARNKKK